jgi:hypothetical protein
MIGIGILAMLSQGMRAEDEAALSNGQFLLLRNGQVLEGKVSQAGNQTLVDLPNGQIRVRNSDVDTICSNMREAYQRKRAALQASDLSQQHLDLAQWCIRHNLLAEAGDELAAVAEIDPKNRQLASLQHRLEMAKEPVLRDESQPKQPLLANDELDRMVRSLPPGVVEMFTQSVQPILLNNCMASGCHTGQTENGLQLHRVQINKTTSRRLTQRNLYAVIQQINRESPAESRLLEAASGPHGTLRTPIFSDRQASQYQRLVEWVALFAYQSVVPASALEMFPRTPSEYPMPAASGANLSAPGMLPQDAPHAQPIRTPSTTRPGHRHSAAAEKSAEETSPEPQKPPADPFDPEDFNRQQTAKP